MYSNNNLQQLLTEITRKRNGKESLLDLILCNDDTLISDIEYHPPIEKSDHLVMIACMQIIKIKDNKITKVSDFYNADYDRTYKILTET